MGILTTFTLVEIALLGFAYYTDNYILPCSDIIT